MQKKQLSPLSILWICNLILFIATFISGPSLSFLKSSVLEYNNISSDPFDGAILPIAYIPDWSKAENINKGRLFDSFEISDFLPIPEYDTELLADVSLKTAAATILHYTYPVVYMGSYRGNYIEYNGSHDAVDIRAPLGTPVMAIANGVVVKVKNIDTGDGKYVIIRHDNVDMNGEKDTLYSGYGHLSDIFAVEGTKIQRGEVLGKVGMTGITTTPHLHFQIDKSNAPFHMYWPYTFREASDLGLDFFGAINVGLGKENAMRYTVHPMNFIKDHPVLSSAPVEISNNSIPLSEPIKSPLVVSSQVVADTTTPSANVVETVVSKIDIPVVEEIVQKSELATPEEPISTVQETIATPFINASNFISDNVHIFSDIPVDSTFYSATKYLKEAGVVNGYADGGFHPADKITRSETILLYDRLFKKENSTIEINLPFIDILPSDEIAPALTRAFMRGIVAKNNYFRPNDSLTRAEAITLLIRTSGIPLDTSKTSLFDDVKINSSHMVYINTFAKYLGVTGTNFQPNTDITRGELAKILYIFNQR
ncbi:MAG: peptidoglycan DD-metalloendopeptidase family protein [Candidatus Gracilibacteria bacterium]|nr:peptidoglycan DD-metalloendopeptidase family protein [Candidatus Gracilibacteria bacterium]